MSVPGNQRPDIAIHLYEPGDGGLDRVAIILANGFAQRGLRTELWLSKAQGPNAGALGPMVRVRMLPTLPVKRGLALAAQIPSLRKAVKAVRPRILLSAGNQSNLPVVLACHATDTAAIAKITNPIVRPGQSGIGAAMREYRFRRMMRLAALTLTLGPYEAEALAAAWPELAQRVAFAHLPTVSAAMEAAGAARAQALISGAAANRTAQLLAVGRLVEQKDHATLLAALARVSAPDWHLKILGDGPLRGALQHQAAALGIADRVDFCGFVDDPAAAFADADVLLLSSRWEGLGAVVLEAFASGVRVVTTDCSPNLPRLLESAMQHAPVAIADAEALAMAIDATLAAPTTQDMQTAMRSTARPYGVDAAIDDHVRLLEPWLT